MKDRFRYRVFDNDDRKMHDVIFLNYENNSVEWYNDNNKKRAAFIEKVPTLQCTGLKDKNGKLIYEGDILDLYVSSKKLYRYEVKYEIGSFMLVSQDEIFDFPNVWNDNVYPLSQLYFEYQNEENCIYQCEIIGNIYENPELLEVTNKIKENKEWK